VPPLGRKVELQDLVGRTPPGMPVRSGAGPAETSSCEGQGPSAACACGGLCEASFADPTGPRSVSGALGEGTGPQGPFQGWQELRAWEERSERTGYAAGASVEVEGVLPPHLAVRLQGLAELARGRGWPR